MPYWPVWIMGAVAAGCAYPAISNEPTARQDLELYQARGNEPGWSLTIHYGRIDYVGNYGEKKISVLRPDPRPSFNGRRYVTPQLDVDVTYSRCNDAMSGKGYEHQVMVTAEGATVKGCGGERRPQWDL
jgi:heat shock protein HslJ